MLNINKINKARSIAVGAMSSFISARDELIKANTLLQKEMEKQEEVKKKANETIGEIVTDMNENEKFLLKLTEFLR